MSIGTGIAVAGIWLAVAVIGYKEPGAGVAMSLFAFIATACIAGPCGHR